ncbi:hypothetical protein J4E91_002195 [Alternaria rosae]|nr:hypothetical protein J4E91_002195 [Alternaria rosae]
MADKMPNIEKKLAACYEDLKDYRPGEDPKDYVFCDASKRMLVANDPDTGNEIWMGVHINKPSADDYFKSKPSCYNSSSKGEQSNVFEAKRINEDHLFNGLPRNKWWIQNALKIYKHKYRDCLSEELVKEQNKLKRKRAKPARTTQPQPESIVSIKSTKITKRRQPNVKITDPEGLLFAFGRDVSARDFKTIAAEIAKALKFKTAPPTRVLSDMRDFARKKGYPVWAAPCWEEWLHNTRQELSEAAAVDVNATKENEDEARNRMKFEPIADHPRVSRPSCLGSPSAKLRARVQKIRAMLAERRKKLSGSA